MLHPDAAAAIERMKREAWDGTAAARLPATFGSRMLGSLALVRVGHSVWTDPEKKRNGHEEPMGGIVLGIDIGARRTDPVTGEITAARRFRCYDPMAPWWYAFGDFDEALIPINGAEYTDEHRLTLAVRLFCRHIADGRSILSGRERQLITDAFHLTAALGADCG